MKPVYNSLPVARIVERRGLFARVWRWMFPLPAMCAACGEELDMFCTSVCFECTLKRNPRLSTPTFGELMREVEANRIALEKLQREAVAS